MGGLPSPAYLAGARPPATLASMASRKEPTHSERRGAVRRDPEAKPLPPGKEVKDPDKMFFGVSGPIGEDRRRTTKKGRRIRKKSARWRSDDARPPKVYDEIGNKLCWARKAKLGPNGEEEHCTQLAGHGTDHEGYGNCKWHFGCTPSGVRNAFREEMEEFMAALQMGKLEPIDPAEALVQEVWRSNGMVKFLDMLIQDQPQDSITEIADGEYKTAAFMDLYEKERMHLAKVAKMALEAGVAERRVQLAEQQGALVAKTFLAFINDMGLDAVQRAKAPALMRKHLLSLGTGDVIDVPEAEPIPVE